MTSKGYFSGKDMFLLPNGATYHLGCKCGEVHDRIITVGSKNRAAEMAKLLDGPKTEVSSNRDMTTYSGYYKGVGISIISIGMGAPMMDFLVREISFILPKKPIAIIRVGTCGIINPEIKPGTVLTAGQGSLYIQTNYNYNLAIKQNKSIKEEPFYIHDSAPCSEHLNKLLVQELKNQKIPTEDGLNASAETFYACQGRNLEEFNDSNQHILNELLKRKVNSCEMETHQLFYNGFLRETICHTAACAIGIVNRTNTDMTETISSEELSRLEKLSGLAAMEALIKIQL